MLTSLFKHTENSPPELLKPRTQAARGKQFAHPLTRIVPSSEKTDKTGKHLTFAGLINTKTNSNPINSKSVKHASTVKPQNRKSEIASTHIKKAVKNADTHLAMIFLKPELPGGCVLNGDAENRPLAVDTDNLSKIKHVSVIGKGKPTITSVTVQSSKLPMLNKAVTKNVVKSQPIEVNDPKDGDRDIPVHNRQTTEKTKRELLQQERSKIDSGVSIHRRDACATGVDDKYLKSEDLGSKKVTGGEIPAKKSTSPADKAVKKPETGSVSRASVIKTIASDAGKSSPQSDRTSRSASPVITVEDTPARRHNGQLRVPVNPQVQQAEKPAINHLNPPLVFMKSLPSMRVGVSAAPTTLMYEGETTSTVVETPGRTNEQSPVSPKQSGTAQPSSMPADEHMSDETPPIPAKQDPSQTKTPVRALRAEVQPSITLELFARCIKAPIVVDNRRNRLVDKEHSRPPSEPAATPVKSDSPSNVKTDHPKSRSHQEPDARLPDKGIKSGSVENTNTQQSGQSVETTKPVSPSAKHTGFISYARTTSQSTPSVDRGDLVNSIKMTLTNGRGEMVLQLKPEVLGRALIILRQGTNGLKLEFEVEHPEARQIIEAEMPQLREALTAAGIQTASIEVRTSDSHQERFAQTNDGSQRNRQHNGRDDESGSQQRQEHTSRPRFLGYNSFDIAA